MVIKKQNFESVLTVIMPVFNEEKTVVEIITRVCKQRIVGELLVIDDGSTDGTKKKLDKYVPSITKFRKDFNFYKKLSSYNAVIKTIHQLKNKKY